MMRLTLSALVAASLFCVSPSAQCVGPQQVNISNYGQLCEVSSQTSTLAASYDPSRCTVRKCSQ